MQKKHQKILYASAGGVATLILSFTLLGKADAVIFLKFAVFMVLLEALMSPVTSALFENYMPVGKIIGIILPGFFVWTCGVILNIPFNSMVCVVSVISVYVTGIIVLYIKQKGRDEFNAKEFLINQPFLKNFNLKYEIIFFFMFLFWAYLIGFKPEAYGTEKFMDYGFLQSMMISTKLPPEDVWFAGEKLNYYYGGQFYTAFLGKLTGTKAEYTYNLMRALIPALMFTGVFGLVEQMTKKYKRHDLFAALSSSVAVFAGNGHYIIYCLIRPLFKLNEKEYWFPDATRFIGHNPFVEGDQTIHEFPCYSFVLGDLHAHMINIIVVVLILSLLYSFLKKKKFSKLVMLGLVWGLCNWTNYWDYIIYIVVICITIVMSNMNGNSFKEILKNVLKKSSAQIGVVVVTGIIAALPFTLNFESVFKGVRLAQKHTALYQLAVLWGIPFIMSVIFLVMFFNERKKDESDIFCFIMTGCAIGLIMITEIVYVKDIYEATNPRANTMFKLTYQSFIMFSICSGYIIAKLVSEYGKIIKALGCIMAGIHILLIGYFFNAAGAWFTGSLHPSERTGLYALNYLDDDEFKDEKTMLLWMKDKAENGKIKGVIAEAPGASYTAYERVSVITGLPTVAGWEVHEWLWRDSYDLIHSRATDIDNIYLHPEQADSVIEKYNIQYIVFGKREEEKYGKDKKKAIKELGEVVCENGCMAVVKIGK